MKVERCSSQGDGEDAWSVSSSWETASSTDGRAAVTCLDQFDLIGDGVDRVIVGHRDGTVRVWRPDTDQDVTDAEDRR